MAVEWSPVALEIYHLIFPRGVGGIVVYERSRRPRFNAFQETSLLPLYVSLSLSLSSHVCVFRCVHIHIYIYIYTYKTRDATRASLFRVRVGGEGRGWDERRQEIEATMVRDAGDRGTNTYIRSVI